MYLRMAKRLLFNTNKRLLWNLAYKAGFKGIRAVQKHKKRLKQGDFFPPFLYISIINSCNLRCQGCWVDVAAKQEKIDVGKMTFRDESDGSSVRYYANIGSLGLSGEVDRFLMRHPNLKQLGGKVLFLYATLIQLLSCPQFQLKIRLDDDSEFEVQSRLVAVANGQFFGGGMQVAPEALLDDGLFDVIWLKEMNLATFLRHLPKVYFGKHMDIPEILHQRAKKVEVQSDENVWLDIDGESPGKLDACFEILPGLLKLKT